MKYLLTMLLLTLFVPVVYTQGVNVGDVVQYQCFCLGSEWVRAKVEQVSGSNVRVRFGNMDNQVVTLPVNSPKLKIGNAARNPLETIPMNPMQRAFDNEASKYKFAVQGFAHYYDKRYNYGGVGLPGSDPWNRALADLAELDTLCRSRYQGITDWQSPNYLREGFVEYRFGLWCEVAANRIAIEERARPEAAKASINLGYTTENLEFGFSQPGNPLRAEVQDMIWNREKWRAVKFAWLKPKFAALGVREVPANVTADAEKRADELWKLVEQGAPGRSYKQPPWRDAAVEAFVKRKLAAKMPGVQIVKIGLDYKTWVKRASHSLVASDDYFNYYKVSYNSYKRGTVLIKVPGRPFCQEQEFVVGQGGSGIVDAGIGGSGTFMRCE